MVRTMNDYWVIGKMSNLREFYVVIHQKNYNFIQIHGKSPYFEISDSILVSSDPCFFFLAEEVRKLCDTQFKSIFFND